MRIKDCSFEKNTSAVTTDEANSATDTPSIQGTTVNSGSFAGEITAMTTGTARGWVIPFATAAGNGPYYIRIMFRYHTLPATSARIVHVSGSTAFPGTPNARVQFTTAGALTVTVGSTALTSSGNLNADQWYRIELFLDRTAAAGSQVGTWRLDGVQIGTSSAVTYGAAFQAISVGGNMALEAGTTSDWFFDDIAINDTTTDPSGSTAQASWPGDGKIVQVLVGSAGDINTFATQTGGTAGAANGFSRIQENISDDATTFNGSSTLNEEDMFTLAASGIPAGSTINNILVHARCRNSTADTTAVVKPQIMKTTGGTKAQGLAMTPNSTTWLTNGNTGSNGPTKLGMARDPDGSAWVAANLGSVQIGYKLTTAPAIAGRRIDVTSVWATIDYSPAVGGVTVKPLAALGVG